MQRFRKFMGAGLNLERVKDAGGLKAFGVVCTYLSDPPEDFDEFEFRTGFNGEDDIVITVAVELGKIKRIIFSRTDDENPDVIRSLTGEQLEAFLSGKGEKLAGFFGFIAQVIDSKDS